MKQYTVNNWEVTDAKSKFFGTHETGTVNIPDGEFTPEQIDAWVASGNLTLVA